MVVVVAATVQGKADKAGKTGPGQTKPGQGTTSKPAKPGFLTHRRMVGKL